ncbi:DUF882 domain-containing protein [Rhizobiaceae bacterium BDR2-2]|uniref:Murein endopeptidase K n=1 Tax=Ectorhizobium quercum TaxID=2965071 RepID=A0AAE3MYH9_9HYPH|nr:DUF882 domain-containing protein [Ectorhizobium quercum]MCX8996816.1 DUF882 domain-containing protein [Ectorhizobium quercum]
MARFGTLFVDKMVATLVALALVFSSWPVATAQAAGQTRSLKIYFVHTGERANIVYKRNGRYDQKGLDALNRLLRDWRRNEPTRMDPRLWDLVWEVYRSVGAKDYIHAVSGYRSPNTNAMLRSRTAGVAEKSQHMLGKAMDFYIPGVPLKKLRETAMRVQGGGVGYYPKSGSPFVHLDVGNVRAWPRMSRKELVSLFPNGKTLHIPADGKPLPGYQQALAEYKQRGGAPAGVMVADSRSGQPKRRNLLTALFGGGDENEDADAITAPARAPSRQQAPARAAPAAPAPQQEVLTARTEVRNLPGTEVASAPVPAARPAYAGQVAGNGLATALYSPPRSTAQEAIASVLPADRPQASDASAGVAPDLAGMAIPVPTLLAGRNEQPETEPLMTASISPVVPELSGGVPLPLSRPSVAESLMAGVDGDEEGEDDLAEQEELSAGMVAALAADGTDARRDFQSAMEKAATATVVATRVPVPETAARQKAQEVAALETVTPSTGRFGDVFDMPVQKSEDLPRGIEAGLPEKGGRPQQADAEKARRAMSSGTAELTGAKLAEWAFAKQRQTAPASAFKAPRVTAQALAGYDSGDRPQQLQSEPDRFSGNSRVLTVNVP